MNSMGATLNDIQPEYIALWIQAVVYLIVVCLLYRYQILRSRRHVLARLKQVKEKRANLTATNASWRRCHFPESGDLKVYKKGAEPFVLI